MTRLTRPFKAYLRRMQMSPIPLFLFVEGKQADPYFYGILADSVCQPFNIPYLVATAKELSGNAGGKEVLLSFFSYLQRRSSLTDDFKGKKTITVIFLDKDIDDLLGRKRTSPHLVYTLYYDILNHIFLHGDIRRAISVATSLSPPQLYSQLGDCGTLLAQLSHTWADWVTLCLFTAKKRVRYHTNYGRNSTLNSPLCGPVDPTRYASAIHDLETVLSLTPQQFRRAFQRVSKLAQDRYDAKLQDTIFKGKWYSALLASHIREHCPAADCGNLEQRLPSSFAATLDTAQPWADHFKNPLAALIQNL